MEAKSESKYGSDSEDDSEHKSSSKRTSSDVSGGDVCDGEMDSDEEAAEVEREFKALMNTSQEGQIALSQDPKGQKIAEGFTM